MAPKAPSGAAFITMAITPNTPCAASSMIWRSCLPRSPSAISANPNRMANSSTCRISPRASAPTTLSGMMLSTKSTDFCASASFPKVGTGARSGLAGSRGPDLKKVAHHHAEDQRKRRDHLEIDQRLDADATDLSGVLDMGNPRHHGAKD